MQEQQIQDFFNNLMKEKGMADGKEDPVKQCQINNDRNFAFIEVCGIRILFVSRAALTIENSCTLLNKLLLHLNSTVPSSTALLSESGDLRTMLVSTRFCKPLMVSSPPVLRTHQTSFSLVVSLLTSMTSK